MIFFCIYTLKHKVLFMIKLSFRIYLLANLMVILSVFAIGQPSWDNLYLLPIIGLFSLVFSLPVIPALFLVFWIMERMEQNILIKWSVLLLLIAICSAIPAFLIEFPKLALATELLPFSMPAAFLGVLFQSIPIHNYLNHSYGKENPETI